MTGWSSCLAELPLYPWGFIVQDWHRALRAATARELLVLHYFLRRVLGASVYIVAEVRPDLGLLRGVFQGFGRRSRIQKVETAILDNPSPAITKSWESFTKFKGI